MITNKRTAMTQDNAMNVVAKKSKKNKKHQPSKAGRIIANGVENIGEILIMSNDQHPKDHNMGRKKNKKREKNHAEKLSKNHKCSPKEERPTRKRKPCMEYDYWQNDVIDTDQYHIPISDYYEWNNFGL